MITNAPGAILFARERFTSSARVGVAFSTGGVFVMFRTGLVIAARC
jgi:hypothetical protein